MFFIWGSHWANLQGGKSPVVMWWRRIQMWSSVCKPVSPFLHGPPDHPQQEAALASSGLPGSYSLSTVPPPSHQGAGEQGLSGRPTALSVGRTHSVKIRVSAPQTRIFLGHRPGLLLRCHGDLHMRGWQHPGGLLTPIMTLWEMLCLWTTLPRGECHMAAAGGQSDQHSYLSATNCRTCRPVEVGLSAELDMNLLREIVYFNASRYLRAQYE